MKKALFILLLSPFLITSCSSSEELDRHLYEAQGYDFDGNYKQAVVAWSAAISIDPKNEYAYMRRGKSKISLGDSNGAMADFNKSVVINTKYAWGYEARAMLKARQNDHRGAIADFNKILQNDPEYARGNIHFHRGLSKVELGELDGACLDFTRAGELGKYSMYDLIEKYCN
jgi:tetratricopeptide (TPR) repeat protein